MNGTYGPSVKVQVKTDINLAKNSDGDYVYALDADTYNFLSRNDHGVRRILAVIGLDISQESVRLEDAGTLLVGGGAWVSLEGSPKTSNTTARTVVLPAKNTLDGEGLTRMLGLSTAKGSFILRIALPLEDNLELVAEQSSNTPELLSVAQSPFGRSVTTRMRKVTERAMALADQVGKGDQGIASFGRFDTSTANATELEALAALGTGDAERKRYELIFAQSPLSEISRTFGVKKLTVTPSQQAVFADAAEYLRTKQPRSEVTVSGLVVSLNKEGASGVGSATILGLDDDSGRPHRVQLELSPTDYEKAIGAHKDGLKVQAKGDLQIHGTKRSLSPLRGFDVQEGLHEPDLFSPWPV